MQLHSTNELPKEYYFTALKEIGFAYQSPREDVAKIVYHGVKSHLPGAETHDIGKIQHTPVLEPGMVLTVNPFVYGDGKSTIEDDVVGGQ